MCMCALLYACTCTCAHVLDKMKFLGVKLGVEPVVSRSLMQHCHCHCCLLRPDSSHMVN